MIVSSFFSLNEKVYEFEKTKENPYNDLGKLYSIFNKIAFNTICKRVCVADAIEMMIDRGYKPTWDKNYKNPFIFLKDDEIVNLTVAKLKIHFLFADFLYKQNSSAKP